MGLLLLAYLGGVLTILSPCILPVPPFVFAYAGQPFLGNGLPMLVGIALTFAAVASLAAVGGGWVVQANEYGRLKALLLLAFFGIILLLPRVVDRLMQLVAALGGRPSQSADTGCRFYQFLRQRGGVADRTFEIRFLDGGAQG